MKFTRALRSGLALLILTGALHLSAAKPAEEMAKAASNFLQALDAGQNEKATFQLKADERMNWHFVPKKRNGLPLKEMNEKQRELAKKLLQSGLSEPGYGKVTNIMALEQVLFDLENKNPTRDPEMYYVSIFGRPGKTGSWGWRVEGHHLSVNFTIAGGKEIAATPSFFGSNPGEVRSGPHKGLRVLAAEEDLGRTLINALSPEQKKKAIFSQDAPKEILTVAERKVKPLEQAGLAYAEMEQSQQLLFEKLIKEYLGRARPEIGKADWAKIVKAGVGKIHFAWAGGVDRGEPHYYRVQGPTFLLEYDNTQNNANHVHAVWRDFEGDFGEDILKKHYEHNH